MTDAHRLINNILSIGIFTGACLASYYTLFIYSGPLEAKAFYVACIMGLPSIAAILYHFLRQESR